MRSTLKSITKQMKCGELLVAAQVIIDRDTIDKSMLFLASEHKIDGVVYEYGFPVQWLPENIRIKNGIHDECGIARKLHQEALDSL